MCKAIQEMIEDGRMEGHQQGLREGHRQGLREGHQQGLREGHQRGLRQGHQQGLKQGCDEGADMLARLLKLLTPGTAEFDKALNATPTQRRRMYKKYGIT